MTQNRFFVLAHDQARRNAAQYCMEAPDGYEVRITEAKKKREQEEKYHCQIADIHKSKLFFFLGLNDWTEEDIKRLLVEAFANEMAMSGAPLRQSGRVVPSLDMARTVQLGIQTRKFLKKEACAFIEYLYSYGSQIGVEFNERPATEAA